MALVPYCVFTVTSTIPPFIDGPWGEVAVSSVSEMTFTLVAGLLPNQTDNPLTEKPDPVMSTEVPPAIGPLGGVTWFTVGGGS